LASAAGVAVAFVFLVWRALPFFPNAEGLVGHDYGWFFPTLVVGQNWALQHGWFSLPEFTPAFCGGIPFLSNPQGVFFSIPQLLLLVVDPTHDALLTLLGFAAVGGGGSYLLLRRAFDTSASAAGLGATLFLLNGFLFYRMVVGHLPFHAFGLVPVMAYLVVSTHRRIRPLGRRGVMFSVTRSVLAGMVVAYFVAAGAMTLEMPLILTIASELLIFEWRRGFDIVPWAAFGAGVGWGGVLSAVKLVPAIVLARQFPRPFIPWFLFASPFDAVKALLKGLFAPTLLSEFVRLSPGRSFPRSGFELGLTIVPIVLIVIACWHLRRERPSQSPVRALVLGGIFAIPLLLTIGRTEWGTFLTRVPVLNNNSAFVHWWSIYLLPLVTIASLSLDVIARTARARMLGMGACLVLALAQHALPHPAYYSSSVRLFDATALIRAHRQLQRGIPLPAITSVGQESPAIQPDFQWNSAFLSGTSSWPCYEPLFFYGLQLAPDLGLVRGPIGFEIDGKVNLVDPAEYLRASSNDANRWRFDSSRLDDAVRFARYEPLAWNPPTWRTASTMVTVSGLAISAILLALPFVGRSGTARSTSR